jgi:hypothetical protein
MPLEPRELRISLDTNNPNHELEQHIMQGSTDTSLVVSLSKDGRAQVPDAAAVVTAYVLYYNDKGEIIGSHVIDKADTDYAITVDALSGAVTVPFTEKMSMSAGACTLHLKVEDGVISFTYTLHFTVDANPVYNAGVLPSDLPTIKDILSEIADLKENKANKDLSNVLNSILLAKARAAGLILSWGGLTGEVDNGEITTLLDSLGYMKFLTASKKGAASFATQAIMATGDLTMVNRNGVAEIGFDNPDIGLSKVPGGHFPIRGHLAAELDDSGVMSDGATKAVTLPGDVTLQNGNIYLGPPTAEKTIRIRRDPATGFAYFERRASGLWVEKLRVADSINVDTVNFVKSNGHPTTYPGQLGLFSQEFTDSETGKKILRPLFHGEDPDEHYPLLASLPDGSLRIPQNIGAALASPTTVPLVYKRVRLQGSTDDIKTDLEALTGDARLPASAIKDLPPQETPDSVRAKLVTLQGDDRLPATAIKALPEELTAEQVRDKLMTLQGDGRLPATDIRGIADQVSPSDVKVKLELLQGDSRLDASAIKNIPQGSPDTGAIIRDKLGTLNSDDRLDASHIKNIPSGGTDTAVVLRDKLTGLQGDSRLDASAIKNIPSGGTGSPDTPVQIRDKLTSLTADERLDASSIRNLPSSTPDTAAQVRDKLGTLADDDRLDASHIKNIPSGGTDTAGSIRDKLTGLSGDDRLDVTAVKGVEPIQAEVARLKSILTEGVYTYRGKVAPLFPFDPKKGYFVSVYAITNSSTNMSLPDVDLEEGTVFCLHNEDVNSDVRLTPRNGETIGDDGAVAVNVPALNMLFMVKTTRGWAIAVSGFVPSSISGLISQIKPLLPSSGGGMTIDQISAALKDRLHTFAEIQAEFAGQLHTYADIEDHGFESLEYRYGFTPWPTAPLTQLEFVTHYSQVFNPSVMRTTGNKLYLHMLFSDTVAPLVKSITLNGTKYALSRDNLAGTTQWGSLLSLSVPLPADTDLTPVFDIGIPDGALDSGVSVMGDDNTEINTGITDLEFPGAIVEIPTGENEKAVVKTYVELDFPLAQVPGEDPQPSRKFKARSVAFLAPLRGWSDPNKELGVMVEVEPGTYELAHAPGYLTQLESNVGIEGVLPGDAKEHDGVIMLTHEITPSGSFIEVDDVNKGYGVQDDNPDDDPNVSGGTTTELLLNVGFIGHAPKDCRVKVYFRSTMAGAGNQPEYLSDAAGNLVFYERAFKEGQAYEDIFEGAFIKAKGLEYLHVHVAHDMVGEELLLDASRTFLCISQFKNGYQTSIAREAFQSRTGVKVVSDIRYMGEYMSSLKNMMTEDKPETQVAANAGYPEIDQFGLINLAKCKAAVSGKKLNIKDDGDILDFYIDDVRDHGETRMMRGHGTRADFEITSPHDAYDIELYSWSGTPDHYTDIYGSRTNDDPVINSGWSLVSRTAVTEQPDAAVHKYSHAGVVPETANNYTWIIRPQEAQSPIDFTVSDFSTSADPAFTAYEERSPAAMGEIPASIKNRSKVFAQTVEYYYSLRYTYGIGWHPVPCGEYVANSGNADISIDKTVNQVPGSAATGGEGAYKFKYKSRLTAMAHVLVSSDQAAGVNSVTQFAFFRVSADGQTFTQIPGGLLQVTAHGGDKDVRHDFKDFNFDVAAGERIAIRCQSDKADGAFIMSTAGKDAIVVKFVVHELVPGQAEDPLGLLGATKSDRETAGDTVYTSALRGSAKFAPASSATIIFTDLPIDAVPHIIKAYKKNSDGTIQSTAKTEEKFTPSTGALFVSFGETAETVVIYEVWA